MSTMPLARIYGPNDIRIDEAEQPACGPDDVLIRIERCGICGSDLSYAKLVFVVLAILGLSSLAMAIFADVGVTVLVILNSLRLLKFS